MRTATICLLLFGLCVTGCEPSGTEEVRPEVVQAPAPKPTPAPAPAPAPKPAPAPEPKPTPAPAPKPEPKPAPTPAPKPAPEPTPAPKPAPRPAPIPAPPVEPPETEAAVEERGSLKAVTVSKAPTIDGTLNDPTWQKCPELILGRCTSPKSWPLRTAGRVLFDATKLYLAFECAEPETDAMAADVTERDGEVWRDDSVELFITGDLRTGYYHFVINPKGVFCDEHCTDDGRANRSWNSSAVVKSTIEPGKRWIVTLVVPLNDIGACVGEDQTWIMNLNRTRPARGERPKMEWSWAVLNSNDYHHYYDYGEVTGVSIPKRSDGVTRATSEAPPMPKEDTGREAGGVTVYRHFDDLTIPDEGQGTIRNIELRIRNSAKLKIACLARGTGGADLFMVNMTDAVSDDNTTSNAYRRIDARWRPILYRVDRFRYNSAPTTTTIERNALFTRLHVHGNQTGGKGVLHLRDLTIYRGEDAEPPPAPKGLTGKADGEGVRLSWERVTDNVGVAVYVVSRAGEDGKFRKIAESALPEFLDKPPAAGSYSYRALAVDFQDNVGPWSEPVKVEAPAGFGPPFLSMLETDRVKYAARVRKVHEAGRDKVVKGRVLVFGGTLTGSIMFGRSIESALGAYPVMTQTVATGSPVAALRVVEGTLLQTAPEYCLIFFGTSCPKTKKAIEAVTASLVTIAQICQKHGTVPIVGTMPPHGFTDPQSKPEAEFNGALVKACQESQIPIAHLFAAFQIAGDRRKLLGADGIQLVGAGWWVSASAWAAAIEHVRFAVLDRPK